ncbi:hypothetical protein C1I98_13430 [Spongiactinospora gelatinilytica]|uniref:Uncharacterized protein n=1 Tax=Spongiactinospora gelatinilytica TaxID=2666298 RepID=A0A2W2HNI3_9ACTN|nr:hypothetical protein [Spongiactinospora gelatinilytica]PZG47467.1 hypothetical protein C1I98_13430 [Spongiactinospora gelatinilytica]
MEVKYGISRHCGQRRGLDDAGLIMSHTHGDLIRVHAGDTPPPRCPGVGQPPHRYVTRSGAPYRAPRALHPGVWAALLRLYRAPAPVPREDVSDLRLTPTRTARWLLIADRAVSLAEEGRQWVEANAAAYTVHYPELDFDPFRLVDDLLAAYAIIIGDGHQPGARTDAWEIWQALWRASGDQAIEYLRERIKATRDGAGDRAVDDLVTDVLLVSRPGPAPYD